MKPSNKLTEYNTQVFNALKDEFEHFQLGFFNGNKVLFIGQNPGRTFNTETKEATRKVLQLTEFKSFEREYETLIRNSKIGRYLDAVVRSDWSDVSFTNAVKVATENNDEPSTEQYEFFFPILMQQIDLLKPKVIACLGKYAGSVFGLDEFYLARRYKDSVVCMYPHPSYIMRKGNDSVVSEQVKMMLSTEELVDWNKLAKVDYELQKKKL
jgi:uracil-DNA glycosylase